MTPTFAHTNPYPFSHFPWEIPSPCPVKLAPDISPVSSMMSVYLKVIMKVPYYVVLSLYGLPYTLCLTFLPYCIYYVWFFPWFLSSQRPSYSFGPKHSYQSLPQHYLPFLYLKSMLLLFITISSDYNFFLQKILLDIWILNQVTLWDGSLYFTHNCLLDALKLHFWLLFLETPMFSKANRINSSLGSFRLSQGKFYKIGWPRY